MRGAGLYIRLPIIQQVNATDEHIESVIHFLIGKQYSHVR